jgi:hypothetical protein
MHNHKYENMKTNSFIIVILILNTLCSSGQKISNIDFDDIKAHVLNKSSNDYYPKLIERFSNNDSTLTEEEYSYIYYGNVFSEYYNPYETSKNEDKFFEYYNKKQYKQAIPLGEKVLSENPVNFVITFKMIVCHDVLNQILAKQKYSRRYIALRQAIFSSGDGNSLETAYVVIKTSDEYELLANLNLRSLGQALIDDTDMLTIDTEDKDNVQKISKLYFNVSKPLEYLDHQFRK